MADEEVAATIVADSHTAAETTAIKDTGMAAETGIATAKNAATIATKEAKVIR